MVLLSGRPFGVSFIRLFFIEENTDIYWRFSCRVCYPLSLCFIMQKINPGL